jgi:hypothetical protein
MEYKTTSFPIDDDSNYWRRLRIDSQISYYMLALREKGYNVNSCLYDVIHRPSGKPVTLTQAVTKHFVETGEYQQKGENGEMETISTFPVKDCGDHLEIGESSTEKIPGAKEGTFAIRETPGMYGARMQRHFLKEPNRYFQRKEICRTEADLTKPSPIFGIRPKFFMIANWGTHGTGMTVPA